VGSLIYYGRPLAEVVEDVQRYSPHQIVVDNSAAGLPYSGSVLQTGVRQWLRGLPEIFPVEILDCTATQEFAAAVDMDRWCKAHPGSMLIRPSKNSG
jgi:ferric-dicitrate binding protein FerR (iron transport regulator)